MQKNDTAVIEITDIGVGGEGIGKLDGYTLFVKDAVIGDRVEVKVIKAKKNYGYGLRPRTGWSPGAGSRVSAAAARSRRCPTNGSWNSNRKKCMTTWCGSGILIRNRSGG